MKYFVFLQYQLLTALTTIENSNDAYTKNDRRIIYDTFCTLIREYRKCNLISNFQEVKLLEKAGELKHI